MEALLIWSLKASGLLVVVFAIYYFLFRNNTAFQLRRILLLSILAICSLAPFIELEVNESQPQIVQKAYEAQRFITGPIAPVQAEPEVFYGIEEPELVPKKFDWAKLFQNVYLAGMVITLAILFFEIVRVLILLITAQRDSTLGRNVFRHRSVKSPFSFGKWIFIPMHTQYSHSAWAIILKHELVHVNQRHTADLLLARLFQSLLWYNPIIYVLQNELKGLHEAQADDGVLQQFDFKTYANTLMNVSLATQEISVTHSFAVVSSFSKRLKLMKTHKTRLGKTLGILSLFAILSFGIIGWTTLKGQDKKSSVDEGFEMVDNGLASVRTPEGFKNFRVQMIKEGEIHKLIEAHSKAMELLKKEHLGANLNFKYFKAANFQPYFESYRPGYKPLYVTQLTDDQKLEFYNQVKNDTLTYAFDMDDVLGNKRRYITYSEEVEDLQEIIQENYNYLMIYESEPSRLKFDESKVYSPEQVDELPQVMGGIENLAKAIALDITIPKELDLTQLPRTVDFEFIVQGGTTISHLNLLTELKGSDEKTEPYYKFFGTVHNALRAKVSALYPWKRGVKDGKEVLVRMKISIPTRYML